jgi:hypothetical protein
MSSNPSANPAALDQVNSNHPGHATGPRTPEGKARASRNAFKHGLYSGDAVIRGETTAGFAAYREDVLAALRPYDVLEQDQAEVMVMCQWRLRRLWRQEPRIYEAWERELKHEDPDGVYAVLNDCRDYQAFPRLSRQESGWLRGYQQAFKLLRLLQDQRGKRLRTSVPLPLVTEGDLPEAAGAGTSAATPSADSGIGESPERTPAPAHAAERDPVPALERAAGEPATPSIEREFSESPDRTPLSPESAARPEARRSAGAQSATAAA